jgi:ABC-type microcin C transport system permease subunit YejB
MFGLANQQCFNYLVFFQQVMAFGDAYASLITNAIFGLKTAKMMDNPVVKSKSIAEFWGRRWNYLFHCVLKVRLVVVPPFAAIRLLSTNSFV